MNIIKALLELIPWASTEAKAEARNREIVSDLKQFDRIISSGVFSGQALKRIWQKQFRDGLLREG